MRPFLLIAMNFTREQMWPLFFLLLWVLGWIAFGLFAGPHAVPDDELMIFRQIALYAVAFAVFFGSSAIATDLRSRRILTVLSKAVSRFQYLAGVLAGIAFILGIFCICTGFTASWVLGRFGYDLAVLWLSLLGLYTACLLTAGLALLLSTFLPPLFAAIGSAMLAGILALLTMQGSTVARYVIPVYGLLEPLMGAEIYAPWCANLRIILLGVAESATLLGIATSIFAGRDLTVAVE